MKIIFWAAASLTLVGKLASAQSVSTDASLIQVNSVLWTQQAVEHRAASVAMYRAAGAAFSDDEG